MTPPAQGAAKAGGMAWVKLDDGFADHPKIAKVGGFGAWLQIQALCYANRNLTDGFLPWAVARAFAGHGIDMADGSTRAWRLAQTCGMAGRDLHEVDWPGVLVDAGIWELAPGGYRIHDYDQYQPSKAAVLAERTQWKLRQQRHRGLSRGVSRRESRVSHASPVPVPEEEQKKLAIARKEKSSRAERAQRASTWPQDFTLNTARHALGCEIGAEMPWEWNKFKDHHQAKGSRFCNWDAAWRTWLRNTIDFQQRRGRG
jgi:hypothetical protein